MHNLYIVSNFKKCPIEEQIYMDTSGWGQDKLEIGMGIYTLLWKLDDVGILYATGTLLSTL